MQSIPKGQKQYMMRPDMKLSISRELIYFSQVSHRFDSDWAHTKGEESWRNEDAQKVFASGSWGQFVLNGGGDGQVFLNADWNAHFLL